MLDDGVELSPADGAEQRRALEQIVTSDRKDAALRNPGNRVTRASDPLEQRRDPMRRANLADEIHVPDVDAQLQRCGGDERAQGAGLEPTLRVLPLFAGEASVMRGDRFFAEPIAQMPREPLRHPPRIHEDEGRAVLLESTPPAGRSTPPRPRATSPRRGATSGLRCRGRADAGVPRQRLRMARPRCPREIARRSRSASGWPTDPGAAMGAPSRVAAARATARGARLGGCRSRHGSRPR